MYNQYASPTLRNCSFQGNSALFGGAMYNNGSAGGTSNPVLINCSFLGNSAGLGGAIYNDGDSGGMSNPMLTNCSFQGNSANAGGAISSDGAHGTSNPVLANCVLFSNGGNQTFSNSDANVAITYSLLEGTVTGFSGTNNLTTATNPFAGTTTVTLNACSPAINAGLNSTPGLTGITADLAGNPRIFGTTVDMGAYEFQSTPTTPTTWYRDADGDGYGNPNISQQSCIQPTGYVANNGDCNDNNIAVHPIGNPTVFGNNTWNVYAYNSGNGTIGGTDWATNYAGYYTNSNLNIKTDDVWPNLGSPSDAANYQGCPVQIDNHSYTAKRQGFTCGYYQLDVPAHDDAAQLFINDVKVWEHDGCCDSHTNVWSGNLGTNDKVEFRVTEGGGGSNGQLSFTLVANWYLDADGDGYYTG